MAQYLLIVVSAFLLAVGVTPVARRLAFRLGVVDLPSARKIHSRPMPLLGGAAIYVAADRGAGAIRRSLLCAPGGGHPDRRHLVFLHGPLG